MTPDETVPATVDAGPPRSRLHRWVPRLLTRSLALATAGAAVVFAVNHGDALVRLELSHGRALQAGLSFLALVGALAFVRRRKPREVVPPGGKKSAPARIKKTKDESEQEGGRPR